VPKGYLPYVVPAPKRYFEAVRAFHAELDRDLPREEFRRSIVQLVADGWSLREIGSWFGRSGERIRQVGGDEIRGRKNARRVLPRRWNDELNRFEAYVPEKTLHEIRRQEVNQRRRDTWARRIAERQAQIAMVRKLHQELGRSPLLREVWEAMGHNNLSSLLKSWMPNRVRRRGRVRFSIKAAKATEILYRLAGSQKRGRGRVGHLQHERHDG